MLIQRRKRAILYFLNEKRVKKGVGRNGPFHYCLYRLILLYLDQKPLVPLPPVPLCHRQRLSSKVGRSVGTLSLGLARRLRSQHLPHPPHL